MKDSDVSRRREAGQDDALSWISGILALWPYGVLLLLVVVFFWDSIFAARLPIMRDTWADFLPWREFAAQALREGQVPLWNPYSGIGQPIAAEPEAAVFYPLHPLFVFLPSTTALSVSLILHLFIAAAGIYWVCRKWDLSRPAALLSAVSFTFSTWMVAYWEFLSILTTLAWTPLILAALTGWIDRWDQYPVKVSWFEKWKLLLSRTALVAVLLAVQYLAGHPEMYAYSLLLVGLFSFAYGWHRGRKGWLASLLGFAQAGVTAALLVLPQFLLTWELVRNSERARGIDPMLEMASIHPTHLITLLLPFYYGSPGYGGVYWGKTIFEFWVGTCYIGVLPLMLAGFATIYVRRSSGFKFPRLRFLVLFWVTILVFGLLLSFGQYTPLYMFFHHNFPGFGGFRWPSKFLIWVLFSLSILGGIGYEALLGRSSGNVSKWPVGIVGVWAVILVALAFFQLPAVSVAGLQQKDLFRVLVFAVLGLAGILSCLLLSWRPSALFHITLVGITFADLFWVSRQIHFFSDRSIYEYRSQVGQTLSSIASLSRVHSIYAGEQQWLYGKRDGPLFLRAKDVGVGETWLPLKIFHTWQEGLKLGSYRKVIESLPELSPAGADQLFDLMNVCYLVWSSEDKKVVISPRPSCLPRAYLVDRWTVETGFEKSLRRLVSPTFDPLQEAIIDPGDPSQAPPWPAPAPGKMNVSSIHYGLNSVQVSVETEKESLLVLSDAWYPGWKAIVKGQERPIWRVNFLFRGVLLHPGSYSVTFLYRPWQIRVGLWVSLGSLFLLATFFLYGGLTYRKREDGLR
jgi:hypothetical protein